jgi:hypothetical protein
MTAAEEWANDGLGELVDDLERYARPLTREEVGVFIRAAYARGYVNALRSDGHVNVLDVLGHRDELALRVPVS